MHNYNINMVWCKLYMCMFLTIQAGPESRTMKLKTHTNLYGNSFYYIHTTNLLEVCQYHLMEKCLSSTNTLYTITIHNNIAAVLTNTIMTVS